MNRMPEQMFAVFFLNMNDLLAPESRIIVSRGSSSATGALRQATGPPRSDAGVLGFPHLKKKR